MSRAISSGIANLLEACRVAPPRHLLYASSSSVYGANRELPFRETDKTDHAAVALCRDQARQ